ncbi:hypothetical protein C8R43DRAFT_1233470 [Mycena crocata]|nr:hypothetical protein C8R43DRAFT_1233470 [Mycena crocata]
MSSPPPSPSRAPDRKGKGKAKEKAPLGDSSNVPIFDSDDTTPAQARSLPVHRPATRPLQRTTARLDLAQVVHPRTLAENTAFPAVPVVERGEAQGGNTQLHVDDDEATDIEGEEPHVRSWDLYLRERDKSSRSPLKNGIPPREIGYSTSTERLDKNTRLRPPPKEKQKRLPPRADAAGIAHKRGKTLEWKLTTGVEFGSEPDETTEKVVPEKVVPAVVDAPPMAGPSSGRRHVPMHPVQRNVRDTSGPPVAAGPSSGRRHVPMHPAHNNLMLSDAGRHGTKREREADISEDDDEQPPAQRARRANTPYPSPAASVAELTAADENMSVEVASEVIGDGEASDETDSESTSMAEYLRVDKAASIAKWLSKVQPKKFEDPNA